MKKFLVVFRGEEKYRKGKELTVNKQPDKPKGKRMCPVTLDRFPYESGNMLPCGRGRDNIVFSITKRDEACEFR